jgi:hypothetical protein
VSASSPPSVFDLLPPENPGLASLHPGVTLEEVQKFTGFEFKASDQTPATPPLNPEVRRLLYGPVKEKLAQVYPHFAERLVQTGD